MSSCDDARIHAFGVTLEALTRLNHVFDRSLREQVGLGQGWFEALLRIERSGGAMTMGTLAEQVALTSGGVTRLVDRLVEVGFAERRNCATDRRVQYVAITDAGRSALASALEIHLVDLDREFIGRISPEELAVVVAVMDRLRAPSEELATN
ncbi:MAG: MarR family winged helix-turn-helix transcriptional regulator [Acidimicrobiia bacterium]